MNRHGLYFYGRHQNMDLNWPYALPESIYNQIIMRDVNSLETKILFEILAEQVQLFTAFEINWDEWEKFSDSEKEKSRFKSNLMRGTVTIQSRLIQVVNKLKADSRYDKYKKLIPGVKFGDYNGRQKYFELNLN